LLAQRGELVAHRFLACAAGVDRLRLAVVFEQEAVHRFALAA